MKRRSFLKGLALSSAATAVPAAPFVKAEAQTKVAQRTGEGALKERYTSSCRVRSGMALGGIGAGSIELRKDGRFYNWAIFNNFPKETGPSLVLSEGENEDPMASNLFFKVRYQIDGEEPRIKLLQLCDGMNEGGALGIAYLFPWMDAINSIEYSARFPFTTLLFTDPDMPFEITLRAWSPFIPHDVKNSALPLVYFDFSITPKTERKVDITLMMTGRNNVGYDTPDRYFVTDIANSAQATTITMTCGGMDRKANSWGEIALTSLSTDSTYYCGWSHLHPYYEYVLRNRDLPNLDDTNGVDSIGPKVPNWMPTTRGRNDIDPKTGKKTVNKEGRLFCTISKSFQLRASTVQKHTFLFSWNFPNLYAESEFLKRSDFIEGHYYSNFFTTAEEVAAYGASNRQDLLKRSRGFLDDFFDSSADVEVLEQVNSQLNTFVTSGRLTKSGDFGILEGLASTWSWGPIATMDVMLYGTVPIIALFPELQKATMRCHSKVQSPKGEVSHGLFKNFRSSEDGTAGVSHRIDLPGQYVIMIMRDYFWTNDKQYLHELYPSIKKAVEYILSDRSFAGDNIPIMRGIECSYDNFPMFGYSSYLVSQWLCAIAGAVVAAEVMGDSEARSHYEQILRTARSRMEDKLWNGKYYRLYNDGDKFGGRGDSSEGCLTDQLIGQWAAHQSALGHLLSKENIDRSLQNILATNYKPGFGLRNCGWPGTNYWSDVDKDIWVDQGNTCWSGVELAFASFLLYEGFYREAMDVVKTVDKRYRKNGLYWNHQEFGGHYFRPMSAWAIINGLLGLGVNQERLRFDPQLRPASFKLFFALPSGTAHFIRKGNKLRIRCLTGTINASSVAVRGSWGREALLGSVLVSNGHAESGFTVWNFDKELTLRPGEELALG